jgi:O-antigen/teichoic acid export membrane protein
VTEAAPTPGATPWARLWQEANRQTRRALASDLVHKVVETFATRLLLIAVGLVTGVFIARTLQPEGRGLYATATVVTMIGVQFGNLGLHVWNTYTAARDRTLLAPLLANSLVVGLGLGGAGVLLALAFFSVFPTLAPVHGIPLLVALASVPISLSSMFAQNLQIGIQSTRSYNLNLLVSKVLALILLGCLLLLQVVTVNTVLLSGFVVLLLSFLWTLWQLRPHIQDRMWPSYPLLIGGIRYSFKAYIAGFFASLVLRIDLLMVKDTLGLESAGYYSIAVSMADMLYLLPGTIGLMLFPKLSGLADERTKWQFTQRIISYTALAVSLLALVSFVIAKPVIGLVYGESYLPAAAPFRILCIAMIFYGINNVVSNYLASRDFPPVAVAVWIVAAAANIGLNLWLIPGLGIVGAAISSLLCYLGVLAVQYIYSIWSMRNYAG